METCRTCAKCDFDSENDWLDLFHPMRWMEEMAHVRLELNIWKVKISPSDGLPQKICTECFSKFCNVYSFHIECQQAQIKLNNIFDRIEEQSMESETQTVDTLDAELLPLAEATISPNEDTLMKIFDISNPSSEHGSAVKFSTLEIQHDAHDKDQNEVSTISAAVAAAAITTTPPQYTADTESSNEMMTTQQQLDEIQKDLVSTLSGDEENALHDLIEVDNDDEIEAYAVSLENLIETDETGLDDDLAHNVNGNSNGNVDDETSCSFSLSFECKYCYKSKDTVAQRFDSQKLLLAHITAKHNAELPFSCPRCELGFRDAASRTVHMKDKHVEKHHVCQVCGKKYADRSNLRHHIEKYHSENDFECTLCEKRFYSRKSLKYHMKWHDPGRQLKCNYCDRLFINQRHLKCHEATHTGLRTAEYCSFCGKSFIHLKTLRWHIYRKHGGEKPFKCSNCTEAFTSYREKRIHMLEYHLENLTTLEKSECMLCHKHFEDENDLKHHMTADHQPKKFAVVIDNNKRVLQNKRKKSFSGLFQCEVCSQRFNMKSALERHVNVHSVEGRPHACPQCPKRFKRIQDMNWHMKTHSNEKPNVCDVCGKAFALKYVLTQHKRSHEVLEKNFKCETCGRAYLFEKSLRVHERVHTGKTYYKCDLCSENFVTHIKFKYHMLKKHSTAESAELPLDELVNIVIPGN